MPPQKTLIKVHYGQTGTSVKSDGMGMREMQQRAFAKRDAQFLLIKSPTASGKSRAIMFIALDKLINQGVRKVIIAVPERNIGGSFAPTKLKKFGFYSDWDPDTDLCFPGPDDSKKKVQAFDDFMQNPVQKILLCTHATLRFATQNIGSNHFANCLVVIDEFHHVSGDKESSRLGMLVHELMKVPSVQIVGSTGTYFRGDGVPVLLPQDEVKFESIVYNFYDQLNGYRFLKSFGIDYHFYQGVYTDSIGKVLNTKLKTIIHIPSPIHSESTSDKRSEVDLIIGCIGNYIKTDSNNIITVATQDGRRLKVADLVNDEEEYRNKVVDYLRNIKKSEDIDIIIALGMAKEGFDWPWCEHALTIGFRGSLTEVIQIIGRTTRDCKGKSHSQYTNLIIQPKVENEAVKFSVNNWYKAITCSLLMEQILEQNLNIIAKGPKVGPVESLPPGTIAINGYKPPSTRKTKEIVKSELEDLKIAIMNDDIISKRMATEDDLTAVNEILVPEIIRQKYPKLTEKEVEEITHSVVADMFLKRGLKKVNDEGFVRMSNKFIRIDDLDINLIKSFNPFKDAFDVKSKSVTTGVLSDIQAAINSMNIQMTEEEIVFYCEKAADFMNLHNRKPDINSTDSFEQKMAEALALFTVQYKKSM